MLRVPASFQVKLMDGIEKDPWHTTDTDFVSKISLYMGDHFQSTEIVFISHCMEFIFTGHKRVGGGVKSFWYHSGCFVIIRSLSVTSFFYLHARQAVKKCHDVIFSTLFSNTLCLPVLNICYRPQRKLREGYVFTGVCLSTGVCLFTGGGYSTPPPLPRYMGYYGIRWTSGRYASYGNAFLFCLCSPSVYRFVCVIKFMINYL